MITDFYTTTTLTSNIQLEDINGILTSFIDTINSHLIDNTSSLYNAINGETILTNVKTTPFEGGSITQSTPYRVIVDDSSTGFLDTSLDEKISFNISAILTPNQNDSKQLNVKEFLSNSSQETTDANKFMYKWSDLSTVLNIGFNDVLDIQQFNPKSSTNSVSLISKSDIIHTIDNIIDVLQHIYILNYRIIYKVYASYKTYFTMQDQFFRYYKGSKHKNQDDRFLTYSNVIITSPLFNYVLPFYSRNNYERRVARESLYSGGRMVKSNVQKDISFYTAFMPNNEEVASNPAQIPLVYVKNKLLSDVPNFDISTNDGSNGVFKAYKTIQYKEYEVLKDYAVQMKQLINSYKLPISYKLVASVLRSIFQIWFNQLNIMTINVYACHSNCHYNGTGEPPDIEELNLSIPSTTTYIVRDSYFVQNWYSASKFYKIQNKWPVNSATPGSIKTFHLKTQVVVDKDSYNQQVKTNFSTPAPGIFVYGKYVFTALIQPNKKTPDNKYAEIFNFYNITQQITSSTNMSAPKQSLVLKVDNNGNIFADLDYSNSTLVTDNMTYIAVSVRFDNQSTKLSNKDGVHNFPCIQFITETGENYMTFSSDKFYLTNSKRTEAYVYFKENIKLDKALKKIITGDENSQDNIAFGELNNIIKPEKYDSTQDVKPSFCSWTYGPNNLDVSSLSSNALSNIVITASEPVIFRASYSTNANYKTTIVFNAGDVKTITLNAISSSHILNDFYYGSEDILDNTIDYNFGMQPDDRSMGWYRDLRPDTTQIDYTDVVIKSKKLTKDTEFGTTSCTYYAHWFVTIKLDSTDGAFPLPENENSSDEPENENSSAEPKKIKTQEFNYGATITSDFASTPVREGFVFGGWYSSYMLDDNENIIPNTFDESTKLNVDTDKAVSSTTYYAKWDVAEPLPQD